MKNIRYKFYLKTRFLPSNFEYIRRSFNKVYQDIGNENIE